MEHLYIRERSFLNGKLQDNGALLRLSELMEQVPLFKTSNQWAKGFLELVPWDEIGWTQLAAE